ncbi:MAG: response regulator [Synechococcales cyanobacterium CRU_2_2]|nr:response regulator [Synechococcales cyanobacterium CRU_2_2]
MHIATEPSFTFYPEQLRIQLQQQTHEHLSGYWQIQSSASPKGSQVLYLAFSRGRLVFAGEQPLSGAGLVGQLLRFIPRLRSPELVASWEAFQQALDQGKPLSVVLSRLVLMERLLGYQELSFAIRQQFFLLFDAYSATSGKAIFVPDNRVSTERPIVGFALSELAQEIEQRQGQWKLLRSVIPSVHDAIAAQPEMIQALLVSEAQKQQILALTRQPRSIDKIAAELGEDTLKIAQLFAPLITQGVVTLQRTQSVFSGAVQPLPPPAPSPFPLPTKPPLQAKLTPQSQAEAIAEIPVTSTQVTSTQGKTDVFVVDDSPMMLKQFQAIVGAWGYSVRCCDQALKAVHAMLESTPAVIFLDINMPEMSGFQLIREIRLQPQLANIPIIILTAEKSFSNQQRARWSKCEFLSKPLETQDVQSFQAELFKILEKVESLAIAS